MPTQLSYPENVIWYVEARHSDDSPPTSGSAVAIRLQNINPPTHTKTYLITCAHVLRRAAQDGNPGFGICSSEILAWRPDKAYTKGQEKSVSICSSIKLLDSAEVPIDKRTSIAGDWVVLEFQDNDLPDNADSVKQWAHPDSREQNYTIIGYPGGKTAFDGEVVKPTKLPALFSFREESNGTLKLQGSQTVAGTSGGGIFDSENSAFTGIHRSRIDSTVQVQAVSAKKIREILSEQGYKPFEFPNNSVGSPQVAATTPRVDQREKLPPKPSNDNQLRESLSRPYTQRRREPPPPPSGFPKWPLIFLVLLLVVVYYNVYKPDLTFITKFPRWPSPTPTETGRFVIKLEDPTPVPTPPQRQFVGWRPDGGLSAGICTVPYEEICKELTKGEGVCPKDDEDPILWSELKVEIERELLPKAGVAAVVTEEWVPDDATSRIVILNKENMKEIGSVLLGKDPDLGWCWDGLVRVEVFGGPDKFDGLKKFYRYSDGSSDGTYYQLADE